MSDLKKHTRTHTHEKPHRCACGRAFSVAHHLKNHLKRRTGAARKDDSGKNDANTCENKTILTTDVFAQDGRSRQLPGRSEQLPGRSEQLPDRSEQLLGRKEQLPGRSEQLQSLSEQLPSRSEQRIRRSETTRRLGS